MENNDLFDFEYDKKEKCWSVTGYYGKSEEVVFPASYKGKPVKKIVDLFSPNQRKRIKCVIIPEGYKSIGKEIFSNFTKLTNIELPKSLNSIEDEAFSNCPKLTNIELPESLTSIGSAAFAVCTGITNIKLPKSLSSIESEAFSDCTGLTSIKLPENLTSIRNDAFEGCTNLTEITIDKDNPFVCIVYGVMFDKAMTRLLWFPWEKKGRYSVPDGITSIEYGAFSKKFKLTSISFPKSLLYADPYSLNQISEHLTDITVSELNPVCCSIDGVLFDKDKCGLILYPMNKGKTDYVIPDGTQYIDNYAFYGCERLVNIVLPESVRFIGDYAFAECKRLKTITISNKLRHTIEYVIGDRTNLQPMLLSGNSQISYSAFDGFEGQFIYRD